MSGYLETFRGVVYPWHCDHQGHMNTMHYVGMFDAAFWHHVSAMGFTRVYMEAHHTGFVDVKDTIQYKAEMPVGSLVVIESGLLRAGKSSITTLHRMLNAESREITATSEKVSPYFDLQARQTTPLPEDLRKAMESFLVESEPA